MNDISVLKDKDFCRVCAGTHKIYGAGWMQQDCPACTPKELENLPVEREPQSYDSSPSEPLHVPPEIKVIDDLEKKRAATRRKAK